MLKNATTMNSSMLTMRHAHRRWNRIRMVHVSRSNTITTPTIEPPPAQQQDVQQLVDQLVNRTRTLMESSRHHVVAFSGGVDSSLVLALLKEASNHNTVVVSPVLGISPAVPEEQVELARRVASGLGYTLQEVQTMEGSDETYIANQGQACLACKTHLYTHLQLVLTQIQQQYDASSSSADAEDGDDTTFHLYNGTNADDVQDPTRLGLRAAASFEVKSPLLLISKHQVRQAARHLGLPNWNYAASPCLRSRLALGVPATERHLTVIGKAERIVRQSLLVVKESHDLRVRMLTNQRARIEVNVELLDEAHDHLDEWKRIFVTPEYGFSNVSIGPFSSGSVATKKQ